MKLYASELDFRVVAHEFDIADDFPAEVLEAAEAAQDRYASQRRDLRDVPMVTIDPPGAKDLDQALHIGRRGSGWRVHYAIADVAAFVSPGGVVEAESLKRGQTLYLPDEPVRLHPPRLSEDRASLLPGVDRPAVVWTMDVDSSGETTHVHVERALVHSVARLDYAGVDRDMAAGTVHPAIVDLEEVGRLRAASSQRRSAINLRLPSQRVSTSTDGTYELVIEARPPVMDYNSEISLMTGMAAGEMMVEAGRGILRTLPSASTDALATFWKEAEALGWRREGEESVGTFLGRIDADTPRGMALMREAQRLLRGANYALVSSEGKDKHAGVGGYYAHVTAPLRRLVDRFATEHCLAICAGVETPAWVVDKHEEVIESMRRTSQLASNVDRAVLNLTEATVLKPWEGHNFSAVVLDSDSERDAARIFVEQPPVLATAVGSPPAGTETLVSLAAAEPRERKVTFAWPAD